MKSVLKVADKDTFALHSECRRDLKKNQVGFNGLDCGVGNGSDDDTGDDDEPSSWGG